MANYRERYLTDSPTGPSFSTARRKRSRPIAAKTSATLEKPLTRESLVYPKQHLSTPEGSGLYAARTPRLPRIHRWKPCLLNTTSTLFKITRTRKWCQRKNDYKRFRK